MSIILYPSDEFGEQELPGEKIPAFVSQYLPTDDDNVHLMAKVEVNGADPVWQFLRRAFPGEVEWNFDAIFLLDQTGEPQGRYTARQLERAGADLRFLLTQSGFE